MRVGELLQCYGIGVTLVVLFDILQRGNGGVVTVDGREDRIILTADRCIYGSLGSSGDSSSARRQGWRPACGVMDAWQGSSNEAAPAEACLGGNLKQDSTADRSRRSGDHAQGPYARACST